MYVKYILNEFQRMLSADTFEGEFRFFSFICGVGARCLYHNYRLLFVGHCFFYNELRTFLSKTKNVMKREK